MLKNKINKRTESIVALFTIAVIFMLLTVSGCYNDKAEVIYPQTVCDTALVTYSNVVVPVLSANCYSCHGGNTPSAAIRLDTYAGAKQQVDNGRLWGAITHATSYAPMPKNSNMLNSCSLAKIRIWIASGAPNN